MGGDCARRAAAIAVICVGLAVVAGACTGAGRRETVEGRFVATDPVGGRDSRGGIRAVLAADAVEPTGDSGGDEAADRRVPVRRHAPFVARQCHVCHVAGDGQRPVTDFGTVCRSCHAEYFEYSRYTHGPVAAGDCLICHGMHVSAQAALLRSPQGSLCIQCHDVDVGGAAVETYHRAIERRSCTECHEAHFGQTPKLLKPGGGGGRP
ncbi:MAG: hypothetical protein HOP29_17580 [Phycisphaerales bacterium]|nr:hypothetical protein [Phycisphaerales bacterium]